MKKLFTNIISIVLLVVYLIGFCGLNLLKHSCLACDKDKYHVVYDLDNCCDDVHICEADPHAHTTQAYYTESPCCSSELIYLQNCPDTLIQQVDDLFSALSLDLHISTNLLSKYVIGLSREQRINFGQKIITPPKITPEWLCCFRC